MKDFKCQNFQRIDFHREYGRSRITLPIDKNASKCFQKKIFLDVENVKSSPRFYVFGAFPVALPLPRNFPTNYQKPFKLGSVYFTQEFNHFLRFWGFPIVLRTNLL